MKNNAFKLATLLFAMGLFMITCKDVSLDQPELDTEAAQDNARTERAVGDVFGIVDNGATTKAVSPCASISWNLITRVLTINYGEVGCLGTDGVTRSGIITAAFTGFSQGWINGTSAVVTFANYKADGNTLSGTLTITCNMLADIKSFTIVGTDMSLTFSDLKTVTWKSNTTMTLISNVLTGKYWSITGTSSGISRKGKVFSNESTALLTDPACKWFVGGTLKITVDDVVDLLTFTECGKVSVKHNNLPAVTVTLN